MRINNNISALNTYRQYTNNTSAANKSMEKLSSGLRINRAGDDAAGLAISEKMRAQIRGIDMAAKNSQDAISLVQTAEGALTETHSILQRMRELAVQSSSDTNETIDRDALQAEFKQLQAEIDDIADQTQFNNLNLLDGAYSSATTKAAPTSLNKVAVVSTSAATAGTINLGNVTDWAGTAAGTGTTDVATTPVTDKIMTAEYDGSGIPAGAAMNGTYTINAAAHATDATVTYTLEDAAGNVVATLADQAETITELDFGNYGKITFTIGTSGDAPAKTDFVTAFDGKEITIAGGATVDGLSSATIGGKVVKQGDSSVKLADGVILDLTSLTDADWASQDALNTALFGTDSGSGSVVISVVAAKTPLTIQTGANETQTMEINVDNMDTDALGVGQYVKIDSLRNASSAITTVDDAIKTVSTQRASLGAMQNRLDHKINNLNTSSENLQAAESRIRDVDMAKEMVEFTKNNILLQAAQSMLAQANAQPQGVLQLLQ